MQGLYFSPLLISLGCSSGKSLHCLTYPHSREYNRVSVDFLSCGSLWRTQSLSVSGPHLDLSLYTEDSRAEKRTQECEKESCSYQTIDVVFLFFLPLCSFNYHIHTYIHPYINICYSTIINQNIHFISMCGFHFIKYS